MFDDDVGSSSSEFDSELEASDVSDSEYEASQVESSDVSTDDDNNESNVGVERQLKCNFLRLQQKILLQKKKTKN